MNEQELKRYLSENLRIHVKEGGFTDPNNRRVSITLDGEEIAFDYFDVVQKSEYEG